MCWTRKKSKVVNNIKKAAKESDNIYLASDNDREGEAIAWHLKEILKNIVPEKDIYRIVFNEITRDAIIEAIEKPTHVDDNKVDAQQTRRILDRIVGYKVSPILWKVITKNLSAGRVQTVALRLICERERGIRDFVPQEYWSIEADLKKDIEFKAQLKKYANKVIKLNTKEQAEEIFEKLKKADYIVKDVAIERKTINDFISSMINKRLFNQIQELQQYKNRLLLIEGIEEQELYSDKEGGVNGNAIRGFLLSILLNITSP